MTNILLTLSATAALILLLVEFASDFGLIDRPDNQTLHTGQLLLIGGVGTFLALCAVAALVFHWLVSSPVMLVLCSLLVMLGIVDDIADLQVLLRECVQLTVAVARVIFLDVRIENFSAWILDL